MTTGVNPVNDPLHVSFVRFFARFVASRVARYVPEGADACVGAGGASTCWRCPSANSEALISVSSLTRLESKSGSVGLCLLVVGGSMELFQISF